MLNSNLIKTVNVLSTALVLTALTQAASAQAVRTGFTTANTLARGDDTYSAAQAIGFPVNFFGTTYSNLYVSMNGYVTFDGGKGTYSPEGMINNPVKIIAPFFADVDTNNSATAQVSWARGTVNGRNAFIVNWVNVGYYSSHADKLNSFQLVLIDRSDRRTGDFDFEFNYNSIQWEAGDFSHGVAGICSTSCQPPSAGYSNGLSGANNVSAQLSGSLVPGAFLDSNTSTGLRYRQAGGSGVNGRLLYQATNGSIAGPGPVINSISPTSATAGSQTFNLTINGSNFANGNTVRWTNPANQITTLTPSSISATQIVVSISSSLVASAGNNQVAVVGTGGVSNSVTFTVNAPANPTLSSISPNSTQTGGQAFNLTLAGTNFLTGATVRWTNAAGQNTSLTPSSLSATQIVVNVGAALIANPGNCQVAVISPSGAASNSQTFTVNAIPPPTVTIRPSVVAAPTDQPTLTISLASPATVAMNGTLSLSFAPNGVANLPSGYIDPGAVFASGGASTLNFTIPAGSTSATIPNSGQFSQGTVAGTLTVTLTALTASGSSVLPNPRPSATVAVARQAPVITTGSVKILSITPSGFTVEVQGYSTTRDLTSVTYTFNPASGAQINGGPFTVTLAQSAQTAWFDSANGRDNGSRFSLQMPFTFSGDTNAIGTATVTLVNSAGTSSSGTGR